MNPHFPKLHMMNDPLPPLGKKVEKPKPTQPDPIKDFEKLKHEHPPRKPSINEWPGSLRTPSDIAGDESFNAPASPTLKQTDGPSAGGPARQFKVGDRVKSKFGAGLEAVVLDAEEAWVTVKWNDGSAGTHPASGFEPVSPPSSTGVLEPVWGPWISWAGGPCPIPDVLAGQWQNKVRRGNEEIGEINAKDDVWRHHSCESDIVAYRVLA